MGVAPEQGATLADMVTERLVAQRGIRSKFTPLSSARSAIEDLVTWQVLLGILGEDGKGTPVNWRTMRGIR